MSRKIAMWMYQNGGGDKIEAKIVEKLKERDIETLTGINPRQAVAQNGLIFGENGRSDEFDLFFSYNAGDQISNQLEERLPIGSPITVTMFRLRGSTLQTDFAKVLTEQVASRIAQKGFAIVADSSRFPMTAIDEDLAPPQKCVLAGAYSVGKTRIFITAAVTTVEDGEIIGSWDWNVPLNTRTRSLLPIKESPYIDPMVNTSGPLQKEDSSTQPRYDPNQSINQPGFEQDIMN
jgi:hypothetical protein